MITSPAQNIANGIFLFLFELAVGIIVFILLVRIFVEILEAIGQSFLRIYRATRWLGRVSKKLALLIVRAARWLSDAASEILWFLRWWEPKSECQCANPTCRVHWGLSECRRYARRLLYRADVEDQTGTLMCNFCAGVAFASGSFLSYNQHKPQMKGVST